MRNWLTYLEGGGACASKQSCTNRFNSGKMVNMSSSKYDQGDWQPYGILSSSIQQNPDFRNFNRVYVHYCSSDSWAGDREASADTGNFAFKGKRIFQATVELLLSGLATGGRKIESGDRVLLAGTSAGAIGAQNNLDFLGVLLPSNIETRGLIDAHWLPADL